MDTVHDHIWDAVNAHLGTSAHSFPELVEQLGIMRFGHRPRVADTFCGSGQIPFEAARLGCDVYASDLNPVACMLTWGAFNIVGGSAGEPRAAGARSAGAGRAGAGRDRPARRRDRRHGLARQGLSLLRGSALPADRLDGAAAADAGRQQGLPGHRRAGARPAAASATTSSIRSGVSDAELAAAEKGTVRSDGRGQDPYLIHAVDGVEYRTKISTLRGDYRKAGRHRPATACACGRRSDFKPRPDDIFQERLYCIQWMRPKNEGQGRRVRVPRRHRRRSRARARSSRTSSVSTSPSGRSKGWVPDMRIEPGDKTDEPDSRRAAGRTGITCSTRGSCWSAALVNRVSAMRG